MVRVRIPPIADIETVLRIYYSKIELQNADIYAIFPTIKSRATVTKLKQKAREYMAENSVQIYNATAVNTQAAFVAWGLDIKDLELRHGKLQKFKISEKGA